MILDQLFKLGALRAITVVFIVLAVLYFGGAMLLGRAIRSASSETQTVQRLSYFSAQPTLQKLMMFHGPNRPYWIDGDLVFWYDDRENLCARRLADVEAGKCR